MGIRTRVGAEGVGVGVPGDEAAAWGEKVADCTAQPLGEDPRVHRQVVPLTAADRAGQLPEEASQFIDVQTEHV